MENRSDFNTMGSSVLKMYFYLSQHIHIYAFVWVYRHTHKKLKILPAVVEEEGRHRERGASQWAERVILERKYTQRASQ